MVKSYSTKNGKQVSIRTNTLEDLPKIRDCLISVWKSLGEYLPESWINRELHHLQTDELTHLKQSDEPNRIVLVAEEDEKIVGVILGWTGEWNVNHLNFMGVEPSHRRRSIGRNLLLKYLEILQQKGIHKVSLNTTSILKPAIRLYIDQGFIPEGLLRREAHGLDIIIYSKFLDKTN
jgi:ribosomal protein S18 acetylase RimI-like enzyme